MRACDTPNTIQLRFASAQRAWSPFACTRAESALQPLIIKTGNLKLPKTVAGRETRSMGTGDVVIGDQATASEVSPQSSGKRIVNDFSIQLATVNGSGSQSANNVLLR